MVVDNTNPTRESRAGAIALAASTARESSGMCLMCPPMCAGPGMRHGAAERVPDVAIWTVRKRLELPTIEEGFDELHVVKPLESGEFQVLNVAEAGRADE